ncbi:MAG TPA: hypothetical protein DCY50_08465 [Franconibacter helveticus]|nr:hypothetical protein [Franconibacter helveticus]
MQRFFSGLYKNPPIIILQQAWITFQAAAALRCVIFVIVFTLNAANTHTKSKIVYAVENTYISRVFSPPINPYSTLC